MIGTIIQNKYKILRKLGSGSYSSVYEAEHIHKNTKVAIKFDFDEISKRLIENEISIYLYLHQNNMSDMAGIKSYGKNEDSNFIIMKKLDCSLHEYYNKCYNNFEMTNSKFLEINKKVVIMLIKLMKNFHSMKLVHRDIKPENFMFDSNKSLCIIDLGISKPYDPEVKTRTFVGNEYFTSYIVHKSEYVYKPKDDMISIFFMMFYLISEGDIPWKNIHMFNSKHKDEVMYSLKKHTDFAKYYKNHKNFSLIKPFIDLYNVIEFNMCYEGEDFVDYDYMVDRAKKIVEYTGYEN